MTVESTETQMDEFFEDLSEKIAQLYTQADSDELPESGREQALEDLWEAREALEALPTDLADEDDSRVETALDSIDDAVDELELLDILECPEIEDFVELGGDDAPSQPVGENLRNRMSDELEFLVPSREVLRAVSTVVTPETEAQEADEEGMQEAEALALDYLIHDWRWEEGNTVFESHCDDDLVEGPEDREALRLLESSFLDGYQVDDIDDDAGVLHLERLADGLTLSVEIDEELEGVLTPGDGLIARIYSWSDGPELGAYLPTDSESIEDIKTWLQEVEGDDGSPPYADNRGQKLKSRGYELLQDFLFPGEEDPTDPAIS